MCSVAQNFTLYFIGTLFIVALLVADLFHPVGAVAVELFHNGDVRHGRGWGSAVPMLLARREPDHVPRPNLLDRASPALCQAAASRHDQGLAQRVGVPSLTVTVVCLAFVACCGGRNATGEHIFGRSATGLSLDVFGVPGPLHRDL